LLAFTAAALCALLAVAAVIRNWRSTAAWAFCVGMLIFAAESVSAGMGARAAGALEVGYWNGLAILAKAFLPGPWILFSITYSRGNQREFLRKWRHVLFAAFVLPVAIALGFREQLFEVLRRKGTETEWWLGLEIPGKALSGLLLLASLFILINLEATMRSAVGTMRWRIKFVVLGLAVIFGTGMYADSQAFLFSGQGLDLAQVESAALLIGSAFIALAYFRSGLKEVDVYPSGTILTNSITVLLAGAYLICIAIIAQVVSRLGGGEHFQTQAILVLAGIALLAVLLLSERVRQGIRGFVSRHFSRPQHDSRKVWSHVTSQMASVLNPSALCRSVAKLISETFAVLSVSIWLVDERKGQLLPAVSTAATGRDGAVAAGNHPASGAIRAALAAQPGPFEIGVEKDERVQLFQPFCPAQFSGEGDRICVPLFVGERWLGFVILADRVNGIAYTEEDRELLRCIGDQLAVALLNLRLTEDLMQAKEIEAFQTMSTFFVHDLKNAVSGLNLTLKNLPVHFDDPEFRADALRGIGNTVSRIDGMIERLSALRKKIEPRCEETDLNQLIGEALDRLDAVRDVDVKKELHPVPAVFVDREQIKSVVTNLLLNARDALGSGGWILVQTGIEEGRAVLTVADNGAGMSAEFMRNSLFRPFQSTKKKGLGIGMFQSRTIVEAHRGHIHVESEMGKGTRFRIDLPVKAQA
jgi:putative PEP-CTERM system histidine kinase